MDQLTQTVKSREMRVREVSVPVLAAGMLLVRTHYSLVSAGTEGSTVKTARKSLVGKARQRPQQVRQVLDVLKRQGPLQTYRAVMKKLDAYSPLGLPATCRPGEAIGNCHRRWLVDRAPGASHCSHEPRQASIVRG